PPFRLTSFALDFTDAYKYLGVWFESNLSWGKQTDEMIARANRTAAVICRFVLPGQPPGFTCVRSLVNALVAPVISFGMPVYEVPSAREAQVDALLARPIRRCLGLPQKSTHSSSVLVEAGILSSSALFHACALRFG